VLERRTKLAKRERAKAGRAAGGDATPEQKAARANRSRDTPSRKRSKGSG
jgi:hypothetical protein